MSDQRRPLLPSYPRRTTWVSSTQPSKRPRQPGVPTPT